MYVKDRIATGHTTDVLTQDEIEELDESVMVFIQEDVGDAGIHLLQ